MASVPRPSTPHVIKAIGPETMGFAGLGKAPIGLDRYVFSQVSHLRICEFLLLFSWSPAVAAFLRARAAFSKDTMENTDPLHKGCLCEPQVYNLFNRVRRGQHVLIRELRLKLRLPQILVQPSHEPLQPLILLTRTMNVT